MLLGFFPAKDFTPDERRTLTVFEKKCTETYLLKEHQKHNLNIDSEEISKDIR